MKKAKRWLMTAKQQAVLEEFDWERELKPREVKVRVDFSAISPGTECAKLPRLDPDVLIPGRWCAYPWSPGYAGCGHILEVGPDVTESNTGDAVAGFTHHASHQICNVDRDIIPLDPRVKPEHAAYLRLASIASTPLHVLQQDVMPVTGVWGLGLIGNLVAQILQRASGRVVGMDPVKGRRELAMRCGIRETLDPVAADFPDRLKALTRGEGLDIAVDTTGHAPTTIAMPSFIRPRGQMVLMTLWRSQAQADATPFLSDLLVRGITLHGAHVMAPGKAPATNEHALERRKCVRIQDEMAAGGLQIAPLISHVVKPEQVREAYDGLSFDRTNWWGVVVDWRD
ncbi:MAG: zinc-binding dehydrogenase [Terrimicrobiaceae bacterium]|nr:zinc-binding dehydrogenase [Terrimicrobiaceae bacterium]